LPGGETGFTGAFIITRRLTVSVTFQTAYPPIGGVAVVAYNGIGMPFFGKATVHVSGVADIETLVGND